ncbi:MAG: efflux RND transporter periplasmic adaptor subunit, partial [Phycisphaerae bacterium]|nr:efflux RND transporter periplasmic adaptor subunit [Phycisphaerae bacterium]
MDVRRKTLVAILVSHSLAVPLLSAERDTGVRAITQPRRDITLSFVQPGRVIEVLFEEGQQVKAGQLVARLDDALEQAQVAQILAQSQDTTQVRASEVSLEQKKVDLRRLEKAAERNAATDLEVEHARLEVKIAELSCELAQFEHRVAGLKLEEARVRVANMQIKNPIDGRVEEVFIEAGESVNALDQVIRVVQTDPLWIDASVPLPLVGTLAPGREVTVEFPEPSPASVQGRVVFVAMVADAASDTIRARIEVPNPAGRPAGERVKVICPTPPSPGGPSR